MCGIFAVFLKDHDSGSSNRNNSYPYLLNGLTVLQHRGQDAAGIHTTYHKHKGTGKVEKVFENISPESFQGNYGVGHVRYCTAGNLESTNAQPLNIGDISLVHNGNLTNIADLKYLMHQYNLHLSTTSDSEIILQLFVHYIKYRKTVKITTGDIYDAVDSIMNLCCGSYSVAIMIRGFGIVAFRDPRGIRPLCFGKIVNDQIINDQIINDQIINDQIINDQIVNDQIVSGYAFASESVALKSTGFDLIEDVEAGECIIVSETEVCRKIIFSGVEKTPCLFEYIYFARPESIIDGISVYEARKKMGEALAHNIAKYHASLLETIDVVIPVPDSARISALRASYILQKPYCEGLIKNAYVGRTFIMPSQQERQKTLKMKLNTIDQEFRDKTVLIIDDSIVRGNTSKQIVEIVRKAGARQIIFASIAPPVRHPNVYGIAIPTESELIASGERTDEEIAELIGADMVIYNSLQDIVSRIGSKVQEFEVSCFGNDS